MEIQARAYFHLVQQEKEHFGRFSELRVQGSTPQIMEWSHGTVDG